MGTMIGHVLPGVGFFFIGLWHLFNHTKQFITNSDKYISLIWFPSSPCTRTRYAELYAILVGCTCSIMMELVVSPSRHTPFNPDGTIPSDHLHNFEHATISLTFFVYAAVALAFDRLVRPVHVASHHDKIPQFVCAVAFAQQLLLFHLHSTDHVGVEGQYHWLLQLIVAVSLATTLLGIGSPRSFLISYIRSLSVAFQGIWLVVTGCMLWTPSLIPKGCFLNLEDGHKIVRCNGDSALHRAKSLVNIEFSWFLVGVAICGAMFYLFMIRLYGLGVEYVPVMQEDEVDGDVEVMGRTKFIRESASFTHSRNSFDDMEM